MDTNIDASHVTSPEEGTDSTTGQISVVINFNGHGASEWSKITTAAFAAYSASPSAPPPQAQIAIFLDNRVITAPDVTGGNQSNTTQITGNFTSDTAQLLANQISAGALPAEIGVVQTTTGSATLGSATVQSSIIA